MLYYSYLGLFAQLVVDIVARITGGITVGNGAQLRGKHGRTTHWDWTQPPRPAEASLTTEEQNSTQISYKQVQKIVPNIRCEYNVQPFLCCSDFAELS